MSWPWIATAAMGCAIVTALGAWYAVSRRHLRAGPPTNDAAIGRFQQQSLAKLGFSLELDAFERHVLPVDGSSIQLYVLEASKQAPVVVFMPGTAVYAEFYAPLLIELQRRGLNVVAFDPRGHGRSGGHRGNFTIQRLVDDALHVVAWAAERFDTKVGFAGSSQGGVCALYAAARGHPALGAVCCHNFTILDGRTNLDISVVPVPKWTVRPLAWLMRRLPWFVVPVTLYLPFGRVRVPGGLSATRLMRADPMCCRAYSLRALGSLAYTELPRGLDEIETPVMLLGSSEDEVFPPAHVEAIFERLSCPKRYINLEGLPHLIYFYRVEEVAKAMADWFRTSLPPGVGSLADR